VTGPVPGIADSAGVERIAEFPERRPTSLRHREMRSLLLIGDALAAAIASLVTPDVWSAFDPHYVPAPGVPYWQVVSIVLWVVALRIASGDEIGVARSFWRSITVVGQSLVAIFLIVLVLFYAAPFFAPRGSTLLSLPLVAGAVLGWRLLFARVIGNSAFDLNVAIVGVDDAARRTAHLLLEARRPYRLRAFVAPDHDAQSILGVPVVTAGDDLWGVVRELGVDLLIIGPTQSLPPSTLNDLVRCFDHGVEAIPATALYEEISGRVLATALEADWYAGLPTRTGGAYLAAKRIADLIVGGGLWILTLPLMAIVAMIIWIDSGQPLLLRQVRVGQRGRPFVIHKFRTMKPDAESAGQAVWASPNDERVTRAGRILRRSRLDELPQLWDVVRGAMSLIGPRPERPEFVERLAAELPLFRARTLVRPGITGWAQVEYRYAASMVDNLTKLEYDLFYLRHLGPLLDLTIAIRTISIVLRFRGQ
jgi:exopolysaccharide biosynthesis polyprenyl glycosylphosphotransferase